MAALLVGAPAAALEVRLVNTEGSPLAFARVYVVGQAGHLIADSDGRCTVDPAPPPPFELVVARADGVALAPVRVETVPEVGTLELIVSGAFSDALTIAATSAPDIELPPATAFTVLGRGELTQHGPATLAATIEQVPGAGRSNEGADAVPSLRGLAAARTLILLDEGRVTAERRAGPSASFLDPETVEEVEVVRGPGSVSYGSDAFGGMIRLRTRLPDPGTPPTLRFALAAADATGERSGAAEFSASALGGAVLVGVGARDFDDYSSPSGEVPNSSSRGHGFRLGLQRAALGGNLRVLWRTDVGEDVGKPASDADVAPTSYPDETSHRATLQLDRPGPGEWRRLSFALSWDRYRLLTERDVLATGQTPRRVEESDVDAFDYGLRVEGERPVGTSRLVAGLDLGGRYGLEAVNRRTDFDASGAPASQTSEVAIASARRDDVGAFVALAGQQGRARLSGGARVDGVWSRNEGGYFGDRSRSTGALSGFLAVAVDLAPGIEASLQGSHGFRDALLSDRYFRGVSGRGWVTGNPELHPETSWQLDAALRVRRDRLQVALFGYGYRIDDLIERYRIGADYFFRNRGTAEFVGGELEVGATLSEALQLLGSVYWLHGEVRDDGNPTDGVPAPGAALALRRRGSRWWWQARFAAFAHDDRPGPTEQEVPGYAVFDGGVGVNVGRGLELAVLGRNLLDRTYLGGADERAVPAPGRSIRLVLRGVLAGIADRVPGGEQVAW
jgi:outer membrane receptor protein involved in Fe transport